MVGFYDDIRILQHEGELEKVASGNCGACSPLHVRLELTETCNFRCRFCWWHNADLRQTLSGLSHDGKRMMPRNRALSLIDELAEAGTRAVSFTGTGDPLMYPHMAAVLERVLAKGIVFGITSNFAMPIGDDVLELLAGAAWLRLSLNAGSPETYGRVHAPRGRAPGKAFGRMAGNVARMAKLLAGRSKSMNFNASYVVSQDNQGDILNASRLACELGLSSISFRADTPPCRREQPRAYGTTALEQMEEAERTAQSETFRVHPNPVRQLDGVLTGDPDLFCFYSNHTTYIDARGDVYPCCYARCDNKFSLGNILGKNFAEFWLSEARNKNYFRLLQDACPPCYYGRFNRTLKLLYEAKVPVADIVVRRNMPDPFV